MDPGRVRFFLSEVWRNFSRTLLMQVTAIGTVTVTIALLGAFVFTRETLTKIGADITRQIEISAFLSQQATPADARALMTKLRADRRVKSVLYVPKAEGLREMRERLRGQVDTSLLTQNPLPDALRVRVVDPQRVREVAAFIRKQPSVANVEYAQDAVQKLLLVTSVFGRIGLGVALILVFTAAIIISNTIRLTVFARRREIAIMQLVGASSAYIRWPFIFEGFLDGVLGAALALGLLTLARVQLLPKLVGALPFLPLRAVAVDQLTFSLELLGIGAGVGIVAAWLSVGRYLRA